MYASVQSAVVVTLVGRRERSVRREPQVCRFGRTAGPPHSIAPGTLAYSTCTSNAASALDSEGARSTYTALATSPEPSGHEKAAFGGSA